MPGGQVAVRTHGLEVEAVVDGRGLREVAAPQSLRRPVAVAARS